MKFGAVFPGQGSQSTSMLTELSDQFSIIKETFEESSDALGIDLWALTTEGFETELNKTQNTQPVMLSAGVSVWRLWLSQGGCKPIGMAGHSLGEYSALVASEVLDLKEAVMLVSKRAKLMQQAVPEGVGGMAAILGLEDKVISDICAEISTTESIVEAVNFNSPGQVVIAGNALSVDLAIEKLKDAGAKRAIKLSVSVPSHCSLMKGAATELETKLDTTAFSASIYPVLQNVSAQAFDSSVDQKDALSKQLYQPVQWVDTINNLERMFSADSIIEFGPGKVLFGLNRRINRSLGNICIHDVKSLEKALATCNS